ncbi:MULTISPECIES: WXG100 family type VII secretion target [unclassified Streptomyces]|uniref:WXG100 family type VII secretion target n=1 Tax=unclassified Streptomyces TaxID=2593676 RepID=UPI0015CF2363|nr:MULTISPECIES: WXG100 family type VII secretion target [unclassified Streptomyces]
MSDKQKPQESHQAEKEQATAQVSAIDMVSGATGVAQFLPFGWKVPRVFGKTNFEGHALNAMIDMVESAKPEDLELAGTALLNAQTAIEDAAEELEGHITRVDWEGESGEAFRKWGANLVIHARKLAAFADAAGTQITAAATGLASVRSAMPPRDTREDPKAVADIPTPKQTESNAEYAAAVKAEKDRQEAINQMNRLASFYAVSEEIMAAQEPPTFEPMPDVGVPKPQPGYETPIIMGDEVQGNGGLGSVRESVVAGQDASSTVSSHSPSGGTTAPLKPVDDLPITSDGDVGTKIDSVGTLSPQETARPTTSVAPTMTGPIGGSGGTVPPFPYGTVPPAPSGPVGRTSGFSGANGNRAPISAQGRTGTPSGTVGGRGTTGPMGRATTTGQSGARGGSASPMGRGVSGGMPRTVGGPASDRASSASSTGAARGNGVVGGRPATGPQGATSSKVPRGTVVGAGGNTGSRAPAGQIGQRGVIGAPNSTPGARPGRTARASAGNPDGVVGTPKGQTPTGRSGGPAGGGAGVPHGRTGNRRNTNRRDREGDPQPETPRRNTPPVTD